MNVLICFRSITFSVGVCVPETCSPSYLDTIMKTLLEEIGNITQIKNVLSISFDERLCQRATKVEYGPMDIFAMYVVSSSMPFKIGILKN